MTELAPSGAEPTARRRREQRSWYVYDWANSAFSTTVVTVFLGPYLTTLAEDAAGVDGRVQLLFWDVRPGSYFSLLVSFSVVLQVLVLPLTGAFADRFGYRRQMLATLAAIGSLATIGATPRMALPRVVWPKPLGRG